MKKSEKKKEPVFYYPKYSGSYCYKRNSNLLMEVKNDKEKPPKTRTFSFLGEIAQTNNMLPNGRDSVDKIIEEFMEKV